MINYMVCDQYKQIEAEKIWDNLADYIKKNKKFYTATGTELDAELRTESIYYKGGKGDNKLSTEGEALLKRYVVKALKIISKEDSFTQSTMNEYLSSDLKPLYAKRATFIGLLLSAGIIKKETCPN